MDIGMQKQIAYLLGIVLGISGLFGMTMYFALRVRRTVTAESLTINVQDVWSAFPGEKGSFESLLYGVRQDFSSTEVGMLVRDCRDEQVGRITFRTGARKGWIRLETGYGIFEADVLPTFLKTVVLHPLGDDGQILCEYKKSSKTTWSFKGDGLGSLESRPTGGSQMSPVYEYTLDGRQIGVGQHIGGALNRGGALTLPVDVPLHLRMFVLALQAMRF